MLYVGIAIGIAAALLLAAPWAWWWARRSAHKARALQSRLEAERLAELSRLTGGLAHEIKNPLATLRLNLQLLGEDWSDAQPADFDQLKRRSLGKLALLGREADRLDAILDDFLRYARRHELKIAAVDLNRVVHELTDFFAPQARAGRIQLRTGLHPSPLTVRMDVDLFKQALLNLLINAQQAMAANGGGELIVRTRPEGRLAAVEVADTGPGIPPDQLERIFHAYYSTKPGGTGLGLATARRILAAHGGTLDVHSEVGRGTSFVLRLALAD